MKKLELYRFKYFDERRGRWLTAKWRATIEAIEARGQPYELIGEPWTPSEIGKASDVFAPERTQPKT